MTERPLTDRRTFLGAAAGVGAVGAAGIGLSEYLFDKSGSTLRVTGYQESTEYIVIVDDVTAEKGSKADDGDAVERVEGATRFRGTVGRNEVDTYSFDGNLEHFSVGTGHAGAQVLGDLTAEETGAVAVEGLGYYYAVTTGDAVPAKNVEQSESDGVRDDVMYGDVGGDVDRYKVTGELSHVELHAGKRKPVALRHSFVEP